MQPRDFWAVILCRPSCATKCRILKKLYATAALLWQTWRNSGSNWTGRRCAPTPGRKLNASRKCIAFSRRRQPFLMARWRAAGCRRWKSRKTMASGFCRTASGSPRLPVGCTGSAARWTGGSNTRNRRNWRCAVMPFPPIPTPWTGKIRRAACCSTPWPSGSRCRCLPAPANAWRCCAAAD